MSFSSSTLVRRGLWFHRRTHAGVVAGAALATAVIVGALLVGDSVRHSLKRLALARLGDTTHAMSTGDRFVREAVADGLRTSLDCRAAAVLFLEGSAKLPDGSTQANRVQLVGVDDHFWGLGHVPPPNLAEGEAVVNQKLATKLGVATGDVVVVRTGSLKQMPSDSPLALASSPTPLRLVVKAIHGDDQLGRFGLRISQVQPYNLFVTRATLAAHAKLEGRANVLLVAAADSRKTSEVQTAFRQCWTLDDAAVALRSLPDGQGTELRSRRVFLSPPLVSAVRKAFPDARRVSTYFVNTIRSTSGATPYSFVSAPGMPAVQDAMPSDAILINEWLAADLEAKSGDRVTLEYFIPKDTHDLRETNRTFTVAGVIPIQGPYGDPTLMPDFPGLADADRCADWKPGVAIDLGRIREKDKQYWETHRGTPKAFVTQAAAESMWSNRFGYVTAIRLGHAAGDAARIEKRGLANLDPRSLGLVFRPVRTESIQAGNQAVDFGQLFIGLSFFIVVAALSLTGMLFAFSVQQRTSEAALLLAVGYRVSRVRRLLVLEGLVLAVLGALVGCPLGLAYNAAAIKALNSVWRGAVVTSGLVAAVRPASLLVGGVSGVVTALIAILLASRRLVRRPLSELQRAGAVDADLFRGGKRRRSLAVAILCLAAVLMIVGLVDPGRGPEAAGAFFGAGALLIAGSLAFVNLLLLKVRSPGSSPDISVLGMGVWNNARRRGRSLLTVGVLSCGVFLVVAVSANRHDPGRDADKRDSGSGGYTYYGETSVPISHDLNTTVGRRAYQLVDKLPADVHFEQVRVHRGDDASCLNLNRVSNPRLLGINVERLAKEGRFSFAKCEQGLSGTHPWAALGRTSEDGTVPAVADQAVIDWGLGKKLGDVLEYTDEWGHPLRLRLVAGLNSSIFQGSVLISKAAFERHFPSASGTQVLLVDVPGDAKESVARTLEWAFGDWGLDLTSTAERLAEFGEVENTYLTIFLALGGLGLAIGCVGLAVVVIRNALERRSEMAVLRAVGFSRGALFALMLSEHFALFALGVVCGVLSAFVAVLPALASPGVQIPYATIVWVTAGILLSGIVWIAAGCHLATRGSLLPALREE